MINYVVIFNTNSAQKIRSFAFLMKFKNINDIS